MSKKKVRIIIIALVVVAVGVGVFFGVKAYNNYITQQQIETRQKDIESAYADFEATNDRSEKLKILSQFIEDKPSTADEISLEVVEAVEPDYTETLGKMKAYFTDDYNSVIKKNTFSDIDIKSDREKLISAIENLSKLNTTVEDEKAIVFYSDNSEYKGVSDTINGLIKKYRKIFTDDYSAVIKANTFDSPEKIDDKDKLNNAITSLTKLKKTVEAEKSAVYGNDEKAYNNIVGTIDGLISKYKSRITAIEKEAEAKKEASYSTENNNTSADNSDNQSYESNNYSGNNSDSYEYSSGDSGSNNSGSGSSDNSGSSGNSGSGSGGGSGGYNSWYKNGDGNTSYFNDRTGEAWDDQGNRWNWKEIQENN